MMNRTVLAVLAGLTMVLGSMATVAGSAAASSTANRHPGTLHYRGTTTPQSRPFAKVLFQQPEIPPYLAEGEGGDTSNRSLSGGAAHVAPKTSGARIATATAAPALRRSFLGLDHFDQRYANNGNQFSLEPPDQGLCAGNGLVFETVNDVLRVFNKDGTPYSGVVDLNSFYDFPPAIDRTTGKYGPFVTDPSCYFDPENQRWIHVVLTLDVKKNSGAFTGGNHLDIAVSQTADPMGSWNLYSLPAEDNGTHGQPDHHCSNGGFCIGDYPHVGADANGFYITTNEYAFFGPEFKTAQLYAMSKAKLTSGSTHVPFVHFDNLFLGGQPGFTVWPSNSAPGGYATDSNGTEYFLSSNAAEEANGSGTSASIGLWRLSNTASLDSGAPALSLTSTLLPSELYALPPKSGQKKGPTPLAHCLNEDCLGFGSPPVHSQENVLDSNDSRMQQTWYTNGRLLGSLDTLVDTGYGAYQAGVAWFSVDPAAAAVAAQGYLGVPDANLTYPAVATLSNGKGVMAFTLTGRHEFPSAAFATIDAWGNVGPIRMAAEGQGPQDGFTEYWLGGLPLRPRWGDYGGAVPMGNKVWIASEYIAQSCSYATYLNTGGTCGGTRTALANWATRISSVAP